MVLFNTGNDVILVVNSPAMFNEFYNTKPKLVDKSIINSNVFKPLMQQSILFSQTTDQWAARRKTLAAAFYKDKLHKMVEVIRTCSRQELQKWKQDLANGID